MSTCELSVVIPTRNRAASLERCLQALARQELAAERFEVVIVDNGSDPAQFEAARRTIEQAPFRTTLLAEPKRGPAAARNRGVERATGQRILFIGDDVMAAPALLAEHLEAAGRHGDVAVLGFTDWSPAVRVTPFMRYLAPDRGPQFRYATIPDPLNCGYQFFYTSNISLERRWLALERFDESFPHACLEDADLGYRLQKRGLRIVFHRPALAFHEHAIRFGEFVRRIRQMGESSLLLYRKYPEMHADHNMIPSEGYRAQARWRPRAKIAALAALIRAADRLGLPVRRRLYERVLEHHFVRSFFEALDREKKD